MVNMAMPEIISHNPTDTWSTLALSKAVVHLRVHRLFQATVRERHDTVKSAQTLVFRPILDRLGSRGDWI